jgi:hypothetical protein
MIKDSLCTSISQLFPGKKSKCTVQLRSSTQYLENIFVYISKIDFAVVILHNRIQKLYMYALLWGQTPPPLPSSTIVANWPKFQPHNAKGYKNLEETGDADIQIDNFEQHREGQSGGGRRGSNCPEVEFLVLFFICI